MLHISEVDCGPPVNVPNAIMTIQEGLVIYTCHECYQGGGAVVCQPTRQWSRPPVCTGNFLSFFMAEQTTSITFGLAVAIY